MRELVSINEQAGEAKIEAKIGLDSQDLVFTATVKHPHKVITDKVFAAADSFIDKIEDLIPGDQKAQAQAAKDEMREQLMKLLGAPAPVETAPEAQV